ncbi:hypothetical protein B0H13DRAFT_2285352 [Mycena leptocephala]|nr:hypothetical protein B0H13DRAFT_2285352 [Mycena leptocephala]
MRIPQELVDEIISTFDISETYDLEIEGVLKSCALVSRPFVRPCQMRLFARISVRDYEEIHIEDLSASPHAASFAMSRKLSALLSCSPHIAAYIRALDLCYNGTTTEAKFVPSILSTVTALKTLVLTNHFCAPFPVNPSTIAVFSLPSLRRVELRKYQFSNPFELESLLSKAICLKELTLWGIYFADEYFNNDNGSRVRDEISSNSTSTARLEALTLARMDTITVEPMLSSFTRIDIKHLKFLSLLESPIMGLLQANARTIQKLKLGKAYHTAYFLTDVPDPEMMTGENNLTFLDFEVSEIDSVVALIQLLGNLGNLKVLKTLKITLHHSLDLVEDNNEREEWKALDTLLLPLLSSVEVQIHAAFGSFNKHMNALDVDLVKKCLPSLSDRGMLHVYCNPRCEVGTLFSV